MSDLSKLCMFGVLAALMTCCLQARGQTMITKNLTIKDGLPSTEVYDVLQDSKGFIWFATDNGVARYDGYEMTVFRTSDGLEDPVVFQLYEDARGRIWFRTYSNRLFYFHNGKIASYRYNHLILQAFERWNVSSIVVDALDRLWLGGQEICHIDADGNVTRDTSTLSEKVPFFSMVCELDGKIYTLKSYSSRRDDSHEVHTLSINGKIFQASAVVRSKVFIRATSSRGQLYISIGDAVFQYDGKSLKKMLTASGDIISLRADDHDNLWIGGQDHGLRLFSLKNFGSTWPDLAADKTVTQTFIDREGGYWFTTLEGGIFYVPDISAKFHPVTRTSKVKAVTGDEDEVVVAGYDETLTRIDAKTKAIIDKKTKQLTILDLFKDSRGNVWYSSMQGLHLFRKGSGRSIAYHKDDRIRDFAEDKHGNIWGIASIGTPVLKKFDSTGKTIDVKVYAHTPARNMLFADSVVYIASTLGLQVYDTSMTKQHEPAALANFKISKMLSLNDSLLLIATIGNGLLIVNNKHWTYEKYSTTGGLIADNIYYAEIRNGQLWLGTEKGMLVSMTHSLVKGTPGFVQFASGNGLVEDKVNFLVLLSREAWAFSDDGISIVPYESIKRMPPPPEFYFKALYVNKSPQDQNTMLELAHDQNNLEITFGFLSFRNQGILCRYRLTKDEPWTYTSERVFRFSSLAPGNYDLEVQYSTDNLQWHDVKVPMEFVIHPPWWQQGYVQLSGIAIIALVVFLYVRHRYRAIHRQQQKIMQLEFQTLERERKRIAKELHDGVATNLSAIKLMVSHLLRKHKDLAAAEVDEHFLSTIKEIKTIIYELTPASLENGLLKGLQHYVEKLNRSIPIKIDLHIDGREIYHRDIGLLSFRIVQELVSNAVKHSGASTIHIHVAAVNNQLKLVVKDDGIGFAFDDSKGQGLVNIQSRIRSVKGSMNFESAPGLTCFTITLPLHSDHITQHDQWPQTPAQPGSGDSD